MKTTATVMVCVALMCGVAMAQGHDVSMTAEAWAELPGWTPLTAADEAAHEVVDGVMRFSASGGGANMIWMYNLPEAVGQGQARHCAMRYRLTNINPELPSYFLFCDGGDERGMTGTNILFRAEDLIVDGQWHIATTLMNLPDLRRLALRFEATDGRQGTADIDWIRFTPDPPRFDIETFSPWQAGDVPAGAIDLSGQAQTDLATMQQVLGLADWFDTPGIEMGGARFAVPTDGPVAISTDIRENGAFDVAVGKSAAELHLLIGGQLRGQLLEYKGWENGDHIWRPTQFLITTTYADGSTEEQMPWCIGREHYGVYRGLYAYAMAVKPGKTVEKINITDGVLWSAFHLVAVTASDDRLMPPEPGDAVATPAGVDPLRALPQVSVGDNLLTLSNSGGLITLDLAGLTFTKIENHCQPDWALQAAEAPLLRVREGAKTWEAEDFEVVAVLPREAYAGLTLHSEEGQLEIALTIDASGGDEFAVTAELTNLADEERRLGLTCPQVGVSKTGAAQDLWYFYPRMGASWSNLDRVLDDPAGGYFPVQWMTAYDRRGGGGLCLATRDTEARYRKYELAKSGDTIVQGLEYYTFPLEAGGTREYPSAYIIPHGGDWRGMHRRYCDWAKSWIEPATPRLDWFRRVWNFRTAWLYTQSGGKPEYNFYLPDEDRYQTAEFIEKDNRMFGQVDMNHIFDWRHNDKYGRWGAYRYYDHIGGLDKFRQCIADQQAAGWKVGLYLDTYLCSKAAPVAVEHGEEWAVKREGGGYSTGYSKPEDPVWNMCIYSDGWPDWMAETCAAVAEETGCDGIYLDEGGTGVHYQCWSEDHGHPVPGIGPYGFRDMSRKVREALPPHVALYTEHCPEDTTIPYMDGGYITALGRSDYEITPGFVHIHRFAFPDFKVIPITSGGSLSHGVWDGLRYSVFNGCALYTLAYGHDDEAFEFIRKSTALLREHEDAFLTMQPEAYVDTPAQEVYCNAFPGAAETVYTFWNGRFRTYSGPVLRVKHIEGATYRDLWTDTELKPKIEDGYATIELTLGARNIGVVTQIRP